MAEKLLELSVGQRHQQAALFTLPLHLDSMSWNRMTYQLSETQASRHTSLSHPNKTAPE